MVSLTARQYDMHSYFLEIRNDFNLEKTLVDKGIPDLVAREEGPGGSRGGDDNTKNF